MKQSIIKYIVFIPGFFILFSGTLPTRSGDSDNGHSQSKSPAMIAAMIDHSMPGLLKKYNTTGAAVALVYNGRVEWSGGFGYANIDSATFVRPNTVFQAASLSKPVTAWAIMKLVEDGKLDPDAPVEQYLTRWHLPASLYDNEGVTVRRLLSHTAGLSVGGYRGYPPAEQIPTLTESLSGRNSSNNSVVQLIKEPGSEFDYSGGGYTLLSLLVEEVTGELFEDYIKREILIPLGMNSSSYIWEPDLKPLTATGYSRKNEPLPNYLFSGKGAASLYTTAEDLGRFISASVEGPDGQPAGRGVLKPETISLMFTPVTPTVGDILLFFDNMALGYYHNNSGMVSHTGSNRGWRNIFALYPSSGDGIVILTNSENGRNLYVELLGMWSMEITGKLPKISLFFRNIYRITMLISLILIAGIALFIINNTRTRRYLMRIPVWKVTGLPLWRTALRFTGLIILPVVIMCGWIKIVYPLLHDLSPLSNRWLTSALLLWALILILIFLFPTIKKKKSCGTD